MSESGSREADLKALEVRLGFSMGDASLLDRALTHASASVGRSRATENYEALEFVGDAALGLSVTHWLYEHAPDRTPGEYSRMRARVVNQRALVRVARKLEIAPCILLGRGEERAGGRKRSSLLADCVEAMIGAVYLDQGMEATIPFVKMAFAEELEQARRSDTIWDFKSRLQHYCQARHEPLPLFIVVRSKGPDHRKEFDVEVSLQDQVVGSGTGHTKKEAEQEAAKAALVHVGFLEEGAP